MTKKLTINDIAQKAEVSTATVSRYLNGQLNQMSKKTAEKLKKIIEDTAYTRNYAAVQLAKKRSNLVAVVASNVDEYFSSEYFKGIVSILKANDYIGVLFDSNSSETTEKEILKSIYKQNFAGVILQPLETDNTLVKKFIDNNVPIVLIDRDIKGVQISSVTTNNFEVTKHAMMTFLPDNFKQVIVITEPLKKMSTRLNRVSGVQAVFKNAKIVEVDVDHLDLNKLAKDVDISNKNNLFFVLKERLLIQLLANDKFVMKNENKQRLSGFIDTDVPRYLRPQHKFIQQEPYLMGATAAEILMNHFIHINEQYSDFVQKIVINSHYK